jgi:photosystem II stability/assembly factor-like uncharacterized protein
MYNSRMKEDKSVCAIPEKVWHRIICLLISSVLISLSTIQPAGADVLKWNTVDTPGTTVNSIVTPSEVNVIASSNYGAVIFAVDIPGKKVYRSTNTGTTWDDISGSLNSAGAVFPVWNIVLCPDNANIIAAITSNGVVPGNIFLSTDGGSNWQNLNSPVASGIYSVDVSRNYGGIDIAIGTRTGAGTGKLFICKLANTGTWADQGFNGDVFALKFSPNYNGDNSILVVSSTLSGTFLNIGFRDIPANTSYWTYSPVELTISGAGTSPKADKIKTADIDLPSDFLGQSAGQRRIYISIDDNGFTGNAGIYRIDDTMIYRIMPVSGTKRISSISYYGTVYGGKLLAGEVRSNPATAAVDVWCCLNPEASCPQSTCLIWQKAVKPPTGGAGSGNANAQVLWSPDGTIAFCGTGAADINAVWPIGLLVSQGKDESAFSITRDGGKTWNQIGIIDTEINLLSDVAATLSSDTLYLASININAGYNGFDSVWRGIGSGSTIYWERVFCILASSNDMILRNNPSRNTYIYAGIHSGNNLYQSTDRGQTWSDTMPGLAISDFAASDVKGTSFLYVLSNTSIRRGEYTGTLWKWGQNISTGIGSGHTIFSSPTGVVAIGDTTGMVSYSIDNGTQFAVVPQSIPIPGKTHVISDYRIQNYLVLYAAGDDPNGKIYGFVPGVTSQWVDMKSPGQGFYGLAQLDTFYGAWYSGTGSAIARTLSPQDTLLPQGGEWDAIQSGISTGGVAFTREPSSLKISAGVNLWAIDNRIYMPTQGRLWNFGDSLSSSSIPSASTPGRPSREQLFQASVAELPSTGTVVALNSNQQVPDITFRWTHPIPANGYDLWIAADKDFNQIVFKKSIIPDAVMSPKYILEKNEAALEPGKTYFWKIRVNRAAITYEKGEGIWSSVLSFSIAPSTVTTATPVAIAPPLLKSPPDNGTNISVTPEFTWTDVPGAIDYEIVISKDRNMQYPVIATMVNQTIFILQKPLENNSLYFWQVRVTRPASNQSSPVYSFTTIADKTAPAVNSGGFPIWVWVLFVILVVAVITIPIVIIISTRPARTRIR